MMISSQPPRKKRCRSKSTVRSKKRRLASDRQTDESSPAWRPPTITIFEGYVQSENFLEAYDHYELFRYLRSPLPTCFRIRSPKVNEDFKKRVQRGEVQHARPLPGISGGWKISSEEDYDMRRWLAANTKTGVVSRQEFVSMLPVFFTRNPIRTSSP
mmetsp:Transcript_6890/g.9208  ORF Transcript_6890/g.9208 Transcript_6890/m.9208 type:complete len:157 (+) Transcript_6890:458-928(+)